MRQSQPASFHPSSFILHPFRRGSWSLAARLTGWYAGSAFVLILAATGFLYWALVSNLDREDDQYLADQVHVLRQLLRDNPDDIVALRRAVEWDATSRQSAPTYVRIADREGRAVLETPGMAAELPAEVFPAAAPAGAEPGSAIEIESPAGKSFRVVAAQAAVGGSADRTYVLQLAFDRSFEENLLARYRRSMWGTLAAALAGCALAGYFIARRGLRPVGAISRAAGRIRPTTLHERIAVAGLPAELSALAGTFNAMLNRLEESFQRLDQFSADIAHELRTPLNNLRGEAEVALARPRTPDEHREVLGSFLEEFGRLSHLVDNLLFLARADSADALVERERVDIGAELETVRDFYEAGASEAGVGLAVHLRDTVVANLDRTLLHRALANLVSNALAHTPAGGAVTLTASKSAAAVCVEVSDTGNGIPADHLPHVFDRFYRVDKARSTASGRVGLGLAIVKSIATLHRGSVTIQSEVGRGTCVRLVFPCESS
jgi:two-component system, OmpR family, heavy metal sensor histidine kinase CusS